MLTFVFLSNLLIFLLNIILVIFFIYLRKILSNLTEKLENLEVLASTKFSSVATLREYYTQIQHLNQTYHLLAWKQKKIKEILTFLRLTHKIIYR